jgi:hypothetical protein
VGQSGFFPLLMSALNSPSCLSQHASHIAIVRSGTEFAFSAFDLSTVHTVFPVFHMGSQHTNKISMCKHKDACSNASLNHYNHLPMRAVILTTQNTLCLPIPPDCYSHAAYATETQGAQGAKGLYEPRPRWKIVRWQLSGEKSPKQSLTLPMRLRAADRRLREPGSIKRGNQRRDGRTTYSRSPASLTPMVNESHGPGFGCCGSVRPQWFATGQILSPFSAAFRPLFWRVGSLACIYTFCPMRAPIQREPHTTDFSLVEGVESLARRRGLHGKENAF